MLAMLVSVLEWSAPSLVLTIIHIMLEPVGLEVRRVNELLDCGGPYIRQKGYSLDAAHPVSTMDGKAKYIAWIC